MSAEASFRQCISRMVDGDLRTRLRASVAEVVVASQKYAAAASAAALSGLERSDFKLSTVSKTEMVGVYDKRMVKGAGRSIYDELRNVTARCPLCGYRDVTSLDHHLPKAGYPALAVTPLNLVPACGPCNHVKRNEAPESEDGQTLHPYFDDVESDLWLKGEVVAVTPAAVRFFVDPPPSWTVTLAARVRAHFNKFRLADLYAAQAAQEITEIRHYLRALLAQQGPVAVSRHLTEQAASRAAAHVNSWQAATYAALAESHWFCSGGFDV